MEINIRLLDETVVKQYARLRLEAFKSDPFSFSESYEDELSRSLRDIENDLNSSRWGQYVFGAFEKQELIGFLIFKRDPRTKAMHKGMLHSMYIRSEFRNRSVGTQLLIHVLDFARKLEGLEQMHLWVLHSTTSAASFYKKVGFISQGTIVKNDLKIMGRYVDAEYMVFYF